VPASCESWELQAGDALQSSMTSQRVLQEANVPGIPSAQGVCPSDCLDFAQDGAAFLLCGRVGVAAAPGVTVQTQRMACKCLLIYHQREVQLQPIGVFSICQLINKICIADEFYLHKS